MLRRHPLSLALAAWAALLLVGCSAGDGPSPPDRLSDGRPVERVPVDLEGVDETVVLAAVEAVEARSVSRDSDIGRCLAGRPEQSASRSPVVSRVTTRAASVTFRDGTDRALVACDGIPSLERPGITTWCGSAHGTLFAGKLRDPRLGLGCATTDDEPVGLLWIEPEPAAAYVSVERDGYLEAHEVAGNLPVRVDAGDVDLDGSRATAEVWEHDRTGGLVRRYRLEASVSG